MSWPTSVKLTVALLAGALAASIAVNVKMDTEKNSAPFHLSAEDMIAMVRAYYPKEFTNPALPDDESLAFVVVRASVQSITRRRGLLQMNL